MTLRYRSAGLSYDITIGTGILGDAGKLFALDRKVLVITDEGVPPQYADAVLRQCPDASLLVIPQGEGAKSFATLQTILSALQERGFTRRDAIVAVGGGVVGDVSGFAAACYQRGIDYYNVPTTLLSQVDSSVGGKTAVNFNGIKNLVGAFHHPSGVLIDSAVLDTLPPRLFAEGLAEVIKMAATCSEPLFRRLEEVTYIKPVLPEIIAAALRIKLDIVTLDPGEKGLRAVLNFGHTVGHAIESAGCGTYYHGEAVAVGMLYTSEGEARQRIQQLLLKYGLPVTDPYTAAELHHYALSDKKRGAAATRIVTVSTIGTYNFRSLTDTELLQLTQARKNEK